jgi:hypothetical protein
MMYLIQLVRKRPFKHIAVSPETFQDLQKLGTCGDTYNAVIARLIEYSRIHDLATKENMTRKELIATATS